MSMSVGLWAYVTSSNGKMAGAGRATGRGPKQQKAPSLRFEKRYRKGGSTKILNEDGYLY